MKINNVYYTLADNQENIALTGHGRLIAPTTDCEIWKHQCSVSIEQYVE